MISLTNEEFRTLTQYRRKNFGLNLEQKSMLTEGRLNKYIADKRVTVASQNIRE